jgi:hypothetical protein
MGKPQNLIPWDVGRLDRRAIYLPMIPLMATRRQRHRELAHLSSSTDLLMTKLREDEQIAVWSLSRSMSLLMKKQREEEEQTV